MVTDETVKDLEGIRASTEQKVQSRTQRSTRGLGMDQGADQLRRGKSGDKKYKKTK